MSHYEALHSVSIMGMTILTHMLFSKTIIYAEHSRTIMCAAPKFQTIITFTRKTRYLKSRIDMSCQHSNGYVRVVLNIYIHLI